MTWAGDAGDIKGATIPLVDDVFTSGSQVQHVALRLRATGAADVRGLVLARVPWSGLVIGAAGADTAHTGSW